MNEFEIIHNFLKPLAKGFSGSLNLSDDAALIDIPEGHELVVTKDSMSEGIHFIGNEDPALIAQKLLRVSLSDLAAKGAKPLAYFLALILPKNTDSIWIERFAEGLQKDQTRFGIHLAGGDTISTQGTMSFSLTALGTVKTGTMLRRNGASEGDIIYVSGTLGDSAIGLLSLQDMLDIPLSEPDKEHLENRYFLPEPPCEQGMALLGVASACMDISDGLVQDIGHICAASGVSAEIEAAALPLSPAARNVITAAPDLLMLPLSGGDDYELLFTVPPDKISQIPAGCTRIGTIKKGSGVTVLDKGGKSMALVYKGYQHF